MFGRRKTAAAAPTTYVERPGAKNRPTPTRREREAARRRPLVPTDRKAASASSRGKAREIRARQREAMITGDEANLPARDRGPVRRFIRDSVDTRWNIGEFLLPIMVIVLALSFLHLTWASTIVYAIVYGLILVGAVDVFLLWRRISKGVTERFGVAPPRGSAMYAVMRAFQMRRSRLPRPQIKRGAKP